MIAGIEGGIPRRPQALMHAIWHPAFSDPSEPLACAIIYDKSGEPTYDGVFPGETGLDNLVVYGSNDEEDPPNFDPDELTLSLNSRAIPCLLSYDEVDSSDPEDPITTPQTFNFTTSALTTTITGTSVKSYSGFTLSRVF